MSFMGIFGKKHEPDDVALIVDIVGVCQVCRHHCGAVLVAYYNGEILIRCNNCKKANKFIPDDATYTDPKKFLPFLTDEDDEKGEKP